MYQCHFKVTHNNISFCLLIYFLHFKFTLPFTITVYTTQTWIRQTSISLFTSFNHLITIMYACKIEHYQKLGNSKSGKSYIHAFSHVIQSNCYLQWPDLPCDPHLVHSTTILNHIISDLLDIGMAVTLLVVFPVTVDRQKLARYLAVSSPCHTSATDGRRRPAWCPRLHTDCFPFFV